MRPATSDQPARPQPRGLVPGSRTRFFVAALCAAFSTGCTTTQGGSSNIRSEAPPVSDDPCASSSARNTGVLVGALAGVVLGNNIGGKDKALGRMIGGVIGGTIGGLIGADIDNRRCELAKIAQARKLEMLVEKIDAPPMAARDSASAATARPAAVPSAEKAVGLRVAIVDDGRQFASGSAIPSSDAAGYFGDIARQYVLKAGAEADDKARTNIDARNKNIRILLVGHTDDVGSSQLNADLSEQRAMAVARIFKAVGIPDGQIYYQGAGETLPIADNRDEAGRARNRRVEIIDLSDEAAFNSYLANRKPAVSYYRPATGTAVASASATPVANPAPPSASTTRTAKPADKPAPKAGLHTTPQADKFSATAKVAANKLGVAAPAASPGIDFGGKPVGDAAPAVDIGNIKVSRSFSIISSANAGNEAPVGACLQDRPRISHGVKSLRDGKEYKTSEYLPGVYDSSWVGSVNGHLVALTHVAVLRDGGSPARKPDLLIYRDYTGDAKTKPTYSGSPDVNVYRGDKALLYRVFSSGPVRCLDIVIPNASPREAPGSGLYYARGKAIYSTVYAPKLAK